MAEEAEKDGEVTLELTSPEALKRPLFANYVHVNTSKFAGGAPQVTLTFIHVYPVPLAPTESRQEGEVVSRVVVSDASAESLRDLLTKMLNNLKQGTRKRKR